MHGANLPADFQLPCGSCGKTTYFRSYEINQKIGRLATQAAPKARIRREIRIMSNELHAQAPATKDYSCTRACPGHTARNRNSRLPQNPMAKQGRHSMKGACSFLDDRKPAFGNEGCRLHLCFHSSKYRSTIP